MIDAALTLDLQTAFTPVRRELFGALLEHLGRSIYTGIYEPTHPAADEHGFRGDVLALVRALGISTVRYPGGNFVSGYRWEDGIGPVAERPRRLDLAWHSTEPNTFGVDEFMAWVQLAGARPMMAVNLGTRGVQDALDLLEYCNVAGGTRLSDLRKANGAAEPYDVRTWCLGNEMDGPWQIGHKTAHEYGRLAAETARAMRMIEPQLTLVACGSSGPDMPTFGSWEATVLCETYDQIDLISAHAYFSEEAGDLASFLASGTKLDRFIEEIVSTADGVRAELGASKRIDIALDEWNVWYINDQRSKPPRDTWPVAPTLLEDRYTIADAVVVGGLLISLLRHADRVASANLAQLVNVIAPIMTESGGRVWKQTTYHPFAQASAFAVGMVLATPIETPQLETSAYGLVGALDAVATHDPSTGEVAIFVVNRSTVEEVLLTVHTEALGVATLVAATVFNDQDPYRLAEPGSPYNREPRDNQATEWEGPALRVMLPATSWNVIRLASHD